MAEKITDKTEEITEFAKVFKKAQTTLSREQFYYWLCQAYGSMSATIELVTSEAKAHGNHQKCCIAVLNEAMDTLKKEPDMKHCILCGAKL